MLIVFILFIMLLLQFSVLKNPSMHPVRGGGLDWYIPSPFRMFPASYLAVSMGQEMAGTFTVFQIM